MRNTILFAIKLLTLLLFCTRAGGVEPKTGDGGVAIRKAQGLIRQISQEKMALEADKSALLNEKFQLEARIKTLEDSIGKLQPLRAEVERYKSVLDATRTGLDSQLDEERRQKQALLQKHNDVVVKANAIYADNQLLVQAVREREQWIAQCAASNKALRALDQEMLKKYQDKGFFQQLGDLDVITGVGQISTETAVEEYRYKLQQLKITPFMSKDGQVQPTAETSTPAATETGQ
ncbi:MAG: hypothetical protein PHW13_03900 [Methylococcales bacterium]|nr:hypothetical protein [Methylococcales bacterium]